MQIEIGTIFKHGADGYWKVTGPKRKMFGGESYPVIKCSKRGKEYRQRNGFDAKYVESIPKDQLFFAPTGTKADIDDGIESGVRLRRIQFLKYTIAAMQKELEELENV